MRKPYTYQPRFSFARFQWLQLLHEKGFANRAGKGPVACACMRLGWTEWLRLAPGAAPVGEQLTPAGRKVLAEWKNKLK
jgi:hypothetical protein